MKKFLTRFLSVSLIGLLAAAPVTAQQVTKLKKTTAQSEQNCANARSMAKLKNDKSFDLVPTIFHKNKSFSDNSLKVAHKGGFFAIPAINPKYKEAPAGMPDIWGSVVFNSTFTNTNSPIGLYKIAKNGESDCTMLIQGVNASWGGVAVDNVYYTTTYVEFLGLQMMVVNGYDLSTGERVCNMSSESRDILVTGGEVYDPTTGKVYGITYNKEGNGQQLSEIKIDPVAKTITSTAIAPVSMTYNGLCIDGAGQLYVLNYLGSYNSEGEYICTGTTLCKLDKTTGTATEIGETGFAPLYNGGTVIDPKTNKMYFNLNPNDNKSYMAEINLSTGEGTVLYNLKNDDQILGMMIPVPEAEATAPAICENLAVNFTGNSMTGTLTLTAPSTFYDGTQGSGNLEVVVLVDDVQMATKECTWGSDVSVDLDLTEMGAGVHNFTVFARNDVGDGPKVTLKNQWIGPDTPEATSATLVYANGNMQISWTPVTSSVNGGYIDLDGITYTVKDKTGAVLADGLTVTTYSLAVEMPSELTEFYYTVEVVCNGMTSAPAQTNTVVIGSVVPPYTSDFAHNGFSGWTVIDANDDYRAWAISGGNACVTYNGSMAMDDWLITPALKLEAGKAYEIMFSTWANNANYPERIEVKYGMQPTPEGLNKELLAPTTLTVTEDNKLKVNKEIVPEQDGLYYIGFHGISDANMFSLWLGDVTIEAAVLAEAPGLASDLKVTPDPTGALKAEVSFKTPNTTLSGAELTSLTKVEVLRGETVVKTYDNPTIGETISFTDELSKAGEVTYTVIGYNAAGAGLKAMATAYVGFDIPADPAFVNIARTATDGEVVLNWNAVTTDIHGMSLADGDVKYNVCQVVAGNLITKASNLTATTYSFQAVPAGQQDFVQVAVIPVTSVGQGNGTSSALIPVGTPFNGINESFPGGNITYNWAINPINGGSASILTDASGIPAQDGDNGMIGLYSQYIDGGANLVSGLVSLNEMVNPGLTFYTYNINNGEAGGDINEISVAVKAVDEDSFTVVYGPETVDNICGNATNSWGIVSISLGNFANKVVQFQITGITKMYNYTVIDNIKVGSILNHDVKATGIFAPGKAKTGSNYNVDVKVSNDGAQVAENFSVELYADEKCVDTKSVESLAAGASATVSFECFMSALASVPVVYYAKVVYPLDENALNNQTSNISVVPVESNLPTATDLTVHKEESSVALSWDAPKLGVNTPEQITDDFEDADAFASEYGDWVFVDVDGSEVGSVQGIQIPGITAGTTKGSFWIWDQESFEQPRDALNAHSGNKYLFALFRYDDGTTNDWAISPELIGDAQTISFYARSMQQMFPEKIAVYTSTGSVNPDDFTIVEGSAVDYVPGEWTQYTVQLPAGAKRFAIRSYATGAFMLMVDDVTYTPADITADLEIAGYNIYRNGVKINDAPVVETSFVDDNIEFDVPYEYVVTVVYTNKSESAPSNKVVVSVSGVNDIVGGDVQINAVGHDIIISNAEGMKIAIVAANGTLVYSGDGSARTSVNVESGVYVVTADKHVRKMVIR
ncbi:MAG: choice-of-anchor J domain-containing protein [Candidatus Amulumruptor caecigallinarius]|nr:choice-of-anchor J domain-containing protein [Candidatus Amulumruptor caecigallinarius]